MIILAIPDCASGVTHQTKPTYRTARILSFPTQLPSYSFRRNYALQRSTFLLLPFSPENSFLSEIPSYTEIPFSTEIPFLQNIPSSSKFLPLQNFLPCMCDSPWRNPVFVKKLYNLFPNFPSLEIAPRRKLSNLHSGQHFNLQLSLNTKTVEYDAPTAVPTLRQLQLHHCAQPVSSGGQEHCVYLCLPASPSLLASCYYLDRN